MQSIIMQRLALTLLGSVPALVSGLARAVDSDPFTFDPAFNHGVVIEDRFAATTPYTAAFGERVVISPLGDVVGSGNVPAEYRSSPGNNFGAVRYSSSGQRIAWSNPSPSFSYYFNDYFNYPNLVTATVSRVDDLKAFMGYDFALVDFGNQSRDVRIIELTDQGQYLSLTDAFTTPLDERGAGLVTYTNPSFDGFGNPITQYHLIAVATYVGGNGQRIITMKRFTLDIHTGQLSVDDSFGISHNGAMDQVAPSALCNAKVNCSWDVNTVTALRTDTSNPTLYLGGTAYARTPALREDGVVVAVNGYDGSLSSSFGALGSTGIYVNELEQESNIEAIAATTPAAGAPAGNDIVYVASSEVYTYGDCPAYPAAVTKLLAQANLGVVNASATVPDASFASNGTLRFGGEVAGCTYSTLPADMLVDGARIVIVGSEDTLPAVISNSPAELPLFAIVRTSDGALTDYQHGAFAPLHANGTPWGGGRFSSVALRSPGHYAVTGTIADASANGASLFGTAAIASDRIFANGFELP